MASKLRHAFSQFRDAFPDWHQDIVELVAESDTVVARFRCTGTHRGPWQGLQPTGRQMRVDEVYFFRVSAGRIAQVWGLEDTRSRIRQLGGAPGDVCEMGSLG
jgi:predicted ester cyclase